jgi:gluconokinase
MKVPGLRSSYEKVGGIVHLGRMLDKIRLNAAGHLPEGYNLGADKWTWFDARCMAPEASPPTRTRTGHERKP